MAWDVRTLDLGATELGVIQELGGAGGRLLIEDDGSLLGAIGGRGNLEVGDLAAEGEKVLDLLVGGRGRDVLDLDGLGGGSHVE